MQAAFFKCQFYIKWMHWSRMTNWLYFTICERSFSLYMSCHRSRVYRIYFLPSLVCVDGMYGHPLPKSKLTSKTQDPWAYHGHLMWKRSPEPEELIMIEDRLSSSLPCDAFPSIEATCSSNHLPFVPAISFSSSMGQALVAWGTGTCWMMMLAIAPKSK